MSNVRPHMPASGTDYMRERAESFQRLRRRLMAWYFVPGMAFFLVDIAAILLNASGLLQLLLFFPGFILMSAGAIKYRCPTCDRIPTEGDGIEFNPAKCGNCGTVLRWENDI